MAYDEVEAKTVLENLRLEYNIINSKRQKFRDVIHQIEEIVDDEVEDLGEDGNVQVEGGKIIMKKIRRTHEGTGKDITDNRQNEIYDAYKTEADKLLA